MSEILGHLAGVSGLLQTPAIWAGLFTLITLEVVLGIDNLVFIAILADRVEPDKRDRARVVGLLAALFLRLILLSAVSWIIRLTTPLFVLGGSNFSVRDLIFIIGGVFLLFKATTELHERLEGVPVSQRGNAHYARFYTVVLQIMVLDAVFSLDAVITAVAVVEHLPVMMVAVIISAGLMLMASKPLTRFVNAHPTVVVLCLSFLLMIGFSLVVEGFGFHVPKGYLYAAIGLSVLIEVFNQIALSNYRKYQRSRPLRERTAEVILRLMGEKNRLMADEPAPKDAPPFSPEVESIVGEESSMISGILSLGDRSLRTLMTPRTEIRWVEFDDEAEKIRKMLTEEPHSQYPVCRGGLDGIIGVARASDILETLREHGSLEKLDKLREPVMVPESLDAIRTLKMMRKAAGHIVLAVDEFGSVSGLLTPVDIFEIIAGEFLNEGDRPDLLELGNGKILAKGSADLHLLEQLLGLEGLLGPDADYGTVAGLLLDNFGHLPRKGETIEYMNLRYSVKKVSERRIEEVLIEPLD